MRFLLTMHMPSANGNPVHQLTVESDCNSCEEFLEELNDSEFVLVNLLYKYPSATGETSWEDKGEIILNTSVIGKVQEYIEMEKGDNYESQRNFDSRNKYSSGPRPPLRQRG
jgi:hypothetical protein